eukprot:CFRG1767T1
MQLELPSVVTVIILALGISSVGTKAQNIADPGGPYDGIVGIPVTFDASNSTANADLYIWTFGDETNGVNSTTTNSTITHTYEEDGTYEACLVVEKAPDANSPKNCTDVTIVNNGTTTTETTAFPTQTDVVFVTVVSTIFVQPLDTITVTQVLTEVIDTTIVTETQGVTEFTTETVPFNESSTSDSTATEDLFSTNTSIATATDDSFSTFNPDFSQFSTLTSTATASPSVVDSGDITGLQANAGGPYFGFVGEAITLSAAKSVPGGNATLEDLTYQWRFGDEAEFTPSTVVNGSTTVTHKFLSAIEYTTCLTLIQGSGISVDCTNVTITENSDIVSADEAENILKNGDDSWMEIGEGYTEANDIITVPVDGGAYQHVNLNQTRTAQVFLQSYVKSKDYNVYDTYPVLRLMVTYNEEDTPEENFAFKLPVNVTTGATLSYLINPAYPINNATVYLMYIGQSGEAQFEDVFFGPVVVF